MHSLDVLAEASELARRGEPVALATVVWRQGPSSSKLGSRALITASGELRGWIGGACAEPVVIREARQVIEFGTARLLLLGPAGEPGSAGPAGPAGPVPDGVTVVPISCQSEGALQVYIEPFLPTPSLVIVGGSPMAQTLAGLAAAIGWRARLVAGEEFTAADADERTLVVIATQGHHDEEAIEQAVTARPAYLGLVASPKRGAAVLGYLAERGVPADLLARVKVPAGLDLGPTTHQEIAVAILAELVQARARGTLASPAHQTPAASAAPPEPAEAIDLVCGMTVTASPSSHPLEHDGVTYYFCCPGCRRTFGKDPAAYLEDATRC